VFPKDAHVLFLAGGSIAGGFLLNLALPISAVTYVQHEAPVQPSDETVLSVSSFTLPHLHASLALAAPERTGATESAAVIAKPDTPRVQKKEPADTSVFSVPFYSQFSDITSPAWKKVGCGIASLAMLVDFYGTAVPVDTLLQEGIDAGAYSDAGWTYAGLIGVSRGHGLSGEAHDFGLPRSDAAWDAFREALKSGPVMASVHYTFDPKNPIPHLVIVTGVADGKVYYNDPAEKKAGGSIPIEQFRSSWKQRFLTFYEV
jgi:uncharacterized protein YvpB